ncbi:response regulator [Desulfococcaceae bacterium HSG8]|nr:response regulator [Desulfococcaceae bacterium HSG8]
MNIEEKIRILILEDNKTDIELNKLELKKAGLKFTSTDVMKKYDYIDAINNQDFDIVLADYSLPDYDGLSALSELRKKHPSVPFVFVSGQIGEELAVQAFKHGATDYVFKNKLNQLPHAVERAIKEKRAEDEVRQLKTTLDATLDCIFIFDTISFCFFYVNHGAISQTGYTRDELLEMTLADLMPEFDENSFYKLVEPLLDGNKETTIFETALCHKDGAVIPVEIFLQSVAPPDEHARFVAIVRDIAERRKAEKEKAELRTQLQQTQRMEALGTLAGGIAHDFNNILMIINGYTEIALGHELLDDHPARHSMEEVHKAACRATDLVQQILAFSRQEEQEMVQVKVSPVVKETLKLLRASLPATIEIRQKLTAKCDTILGDPSQFYQVLMNLCTNASHAMGGESGALEVCVTDAEVNSCPDLNPGHYLLLSVSDTGHGIEPSAMEHIFEPYFTTKPRGEGTGLGLAVTHGVVTSFGGTIRVRSKPGEGTTFDVFFPISTEAGGSEIKTSAPVPMGNNEHILLVDDEERLLSMGKRMLKNLGYKVSARTDSVAALEDFRSRPEAFDLVITDMTMPVLTGDKLALALMHIRPDIPVILWTGYSNQITKEKARDMGIREFLMKPPSIQNIAQAVRRALDRGKG